MALFAIFPDVVSAANPFDLDTGKVNLDAEDQKTVTKIKNSFSTAMGDNFAGDLSNLFLSFQHIARFIVVIMTAMAGMMIAFGLGGASQMFIKWIFGVGVALNIADFGWSLFDESTYWVDTSTKEDGSKNSEASEADKKLDKVTKIHSANDENKAEWYDVFSNFMGFYKEGIIDPAYARLMPIAVKMTMVLWCIDTAMKVALGLTQQDLVNFFTKQILKLGIYIFLITNWWSPIGSSQAKDLSEKAGSNMQIMAVLGDGFENLGYYAAGGKEDDLKNSDDEIVTMQSNSIFKNTIKLWSVMWGALSNNMQETTKEESAQEGTKKEDKGVIDTTLDEGISAGVDKLKEKFGEKVEEVKNGAKRVTGTLLLGPLMPSILVFDLVLLFWIIGMLIIMAVDMFMVRIEFYTMAVLTVMLLPFAMIDQLKFLADKAISLMFNLAIKCFVMAFMSVAVVKILSSFIAKVKSEETGWFLTWFLDFTVILQLWLLVFFMMLLVKKIPQLCNGLLSGNPSLSGGDLMQQVTKTVGTAAAAGVTVASAAVTGGASAAAGAGSMAAKLGKGAVGAIKGGMGAMGRGAMNYALTQNPLGQSFAQGMNLFSGNGQTPGLAQKGGLSQALGLSTRDVTSGTSKGLVDRMKGDTGEKPKGNSTSNNNNQNQNTPAATGKDGGKETIDKQTGIISEKTEKTKEVVQGDSKNAPIGNDVNRDKSNSTANNTQFDKLPNMTGGTSPTPSTQTFNTERNQNPQTNQTVVTNTKTDTLKNSNSEKNNTKK